MSTLYLQPSKHEKRKIVYRVLHQLDWPLIASAACLVIYGLLAVYSATARFGNPQEFYLKQLTALGTGVALFLVLTSIPYRMYRQYSALLYIVSILLLVLVLFFGVKVRGARSWFNLYLWHFQPAEVTKIIFVLVLAAYLDKYWVQIKNLRTVFFSLLIALGNVLLILIQPDFSSCIIYFPVLLGMLYIAGTRQAHIWSIVTYGSITIMLPLLKTYLKLQPELIKNSESIRFIYEALSGGWQSIVGLLVIIILVFAAWWLLVRFMIFVPIVLPVVAAALIILGAGSSYFFDRSMKEYQQKRLIVFLNPTIDPLGAGYTIEQSKIAIGSGRFFGKGYLSGTQSRLGFVPDQHTDFIFSVISEELGFFWGGMAILLYGFIIVRARRIALDARDRYASLVASGILCMFMFYFVINVGMVMGLMPVTGLPLPLVSYGGSSLISSFAALGILMSIHVRRYTH